MTERLTTLGGGSQISSERARLLARVIDRLRGLPVSLSLLYVAIARRLDWAADALNTPGHVIVRIGVDTAPILIDPFRGGRVINPPGLQALVAAARGDAMISAADVTAMTNREVLGTITMCWFDERGISRLCPVSVSDRSVGWHHDDPAFMQRVTITADAGGRRMIIRASSPGSPPYRPGQISIGAWVTFTAALTASRLRIPGSTGAAQDRPVSRR